MPYLLHMMSYFNTKLNGGVPVSLNITQHGDAVPTFPLVLKTKRHPTVFTFTKLNGGVASTFPLVLKPLPHIHNSYQTKWHRSVFTFNKLNDGVPLTR
jgi:hypothetical protein